MGSLVFRAQAVPSASQAWRVSQYPLLSPPCFSRAKGMLSVTGHEALQTHRRSLLRSSSQNIVSPVAGLDKSLTGWRINQKKNSSFYTIYFYHQQRLEHALRWLWMSPDYIIELWCLCDPRQCFTENPMTWSELLGNSCQAADHSALCTVALPSAWRRERPSFPFYQPKHSDDFRH